MTAAHIPSRQLYRVWVRPTPAATTALAALSPLRVLTETLADFAIRDGCGRRTPRHEDVTLRRDAPALTSLFGSIPMRVVEVAPPRRTAAREFSAAAASAKRVADSEERIDHRRGQSAAVRT